MEIRQAANRLAAYANAATTILVCGTFKKIFSRCTCEVYYINVKKNVIKKKSERSAKSKV